MFKNVPKNLKILLSVRLSLLGLILCVVTSNPTLASKPTTPKGCKRSNVQRIKGKLHGVEIRCWNPSRLRSLRQWKHGKATGRWVKSNKSGKTVLVGHFLNGKRHGWFQRFFPDGSKQSKGRYHYGEATGESFAWWPNGKLRYQGSWKNGKQEGTWYHWWSNGRRQAIYGWMDSDAHGKWLEWWPNGHRKAIFRFQKGKQQGETRLWYQTGKPYALSYFKNNKKTGSWMFWHPNGQLSEVQTWNNHKKHGPWLKFTKQGQPISRQYYQDDKRHGVWLLWHPNGKRKARYNFVKDSQSGWNLNWDLSGKLLSKGQWVSHAPHGLWTRWSTSTKKRWLESWNVGEAQFPWKQRAGKTLLSFRPKVRSKPKSPTSMKVVRRKTPQTWTHTPGPKPVEMLRAVLRANAKRMHKAGYALYESYCHVGAAFSASRLHQMGIQAQLFQPIPFHMLTFFDVNKQRYYVDQTMAQFFIKGSNARKILLEQGGFVGTSSEFHRFYRTFADDALSWDNYTDTGYLKPEDSLETNGVLPYHKWKEHSLGWLDRKTLNSQKTRGRRITVSWYQNFRTETSYNQATGLYWTAMYFYTLFDSVGNKSLEPFFDNKPFP